MNKSLSVILPVYNAESKLAPMAKQLLEITAELTSELELLIVDDGSTDDTEEVAMALCRQFPQIRAIRHANRLGHVDAVKAGIAGTTGGVVMIQSVDAPVSYEAVRRLWDMRENEELAFARTEPAHANAAPVMHSRPTWSGGTQMILRDAVDELKVPATDSASAQTINRVTRTDRIASPAAPAMFQQISNIEMHADR